MSPGAAAIVLGAAATAVFLTDRLWVIAFVVAALLAVCLRAPAGRRRLYLIGALVSGVGVIVISPFVASSGTGELIWEGPIVPVLGQLDLTTGEVVVALLSGLRLVVVSLAFAVYALLLDHDRLVASAGRARRSALLVALATRLVPSLERDAAGLAEAVRGRGIELSGVRGYATLVSPLVAGSLERASRLAEAMEARGYGRDGASRAPRAGWTALDRLAVLGAGALLGVVAWL